MVQDLTARFGGYLGNIIGANPGLAQSRATNQSSHLEVEQPKEQSYPEVLGPFTSSYRRTSRRPRRS